MTLGRDIVFLIQRLPQGCPPNGGTDLRSATSRRAAHYPDAPARESGRSTSLGDSSSLARRVGVSVPLPCHETTECSGYRGMAASAVARCNVGFLQASERSQTV